MELRGGVMGCGVDGGVMECGFEAYGVVLRFLVWFGVFFVFLLNFSFIIVSIIVHH